MPLYDLPRYWYCRPIVPYSALVSLLVSYENFHQQVQNLTAAKKYSNCQNPTQIQYVEKTYIYHNNP